MSRTATLERAATKLGVTLVLAIAMAATASTAMAQAVPLIFPVGDGEPGVATADGAGGGTESDGTGEGNGGTPVTPVTFLNDPAGLNLPVSIQIGDGTAEGEQRDLSTTIQILIVMTALTLAPALLLTMTSFTRIIIVLSFLKRALATQEAPPNQIMIGIALFLTLAVMSPVLTTIHEEALAPYMAKEMSLQEAGTRAGAILSKFLIRQTRETDLSLIYKLSREAPPATAAEVPLRVLIPAFVVSELKTAFQMGFVIFLPFLVIDMAVASILLSMGMFMLPPIIISTPFKILLFILVDGWYLVVQSLFRSFN